MCPVVKSEIYIYLISCIVCILILCPPTSQLGQEASFEGGQYCSVPVPPGESRVILQKAKKCPDVFWPFAIWLCDTMGPKNVPQISSIYILEIQGPMGPSF